jgi:hypothetical protein
MVAKNCLFGNITEDSPGKNCTDVAKLILPENLAEDMVAKYLC